MSHQRRISLIGLGYVGLGTAVIFGQVSTVIAFDIDERRIEELQQGHDRNGEVSDEELRGTQLFFTNDPADLKKADFHIISVPTPLDPSKKPNLSILLAASKTVGEQLKKGDIVVYESTVYPGATEEQCIPVLEKASHLRCGHDFSVGFSPERINPADKQHTFQSVIKVVSATDERALAIISEVYRRVVTAGVFPVSSMRVAEAVKVIENTQRDVNIAFMNDIDMMLHRLGIDMGEVISAMKTKWNFMSFEPGLVGGHCIGVNSYYLMHKAEEMGYHSEIIRAARRVNETIPSFIVDETIKKLIHMNVSIHGAHIGILGLTYKENCADVRDTRVIDIIRALQSYDVTVVVHDPFADPVEVHHEYGIDLVDWDGLKNLDAVMLTVAHKQYKSLLEKDFLGMLKPNALIVDIKNVLNLDPCSEDKWTIWRL